MYRGISPMDGVPEAELLSIFPSLVNFSGAENPGIIG